MRARVLLYFSLACAPLLGACEGAASGRSTQDGADLNASDGSRTDGAVVAPALPLRVVVISDLNGSYGSTTYDANVHAAVARIVALDPDLVLATGDMVAGQQSGLDYPAMWAGFHAAVTTPLATAGIPFAVTPGNHDASGYATFEGERSQFVAEWTSRKPAVTFVDDASYPLRYAFTMGDTLFISLDDTTVGVLAASQMQWLEGVLTANAQYPSKIIFGHVPLYPFSQGRETEIIGDPALETMLNTHGVTAFVSGHHHAYYPGQRSALRLIGMPCLGSGSRKLIGDTVDSAHAFAAFEIKDGAITTLEGYREPDFVSTIDRATLPAYVNEGAHRIDRDDLVAP